MWVRLVGMDDHSCRGELVRYRSYRKDEVHTKKMIESKLSLQKYVVVFSSERRPNHHGVSPDQEQVRRRERSVHQRRHKHR